MIKKINKHEQSCCQEGGVGVSGSLFVAGGETCVKKSDELREDENMIHDKWDVKVI